MKFSDLSAVLLIEACALHSVGAQRYWGGTVILQIEATVGRGEPAMNLHLSNSVSS